MVTVLSGENSGIESEVKGYRLNGGDSSMCLK